MPRYATLPPLELSAVEDHAHDLILRQPASPHPETPDDEDRRVRACPGCSEAVPHDETGDHVLRCDPLLAASFEDLATDQWGFVRRRLVDTGRGE